MVEGLLERLEAVLDELAAVDVDALDDTAAHDAVVALGRQSTRLEAQWCRLIGVWDRRQLWVGDGSKAAGARLARETHLRRGDTDRLVRRARDLPAMPHSGAAYVTGEISGAHVDLVGSCNREWRNADFADAEERLVNLCRTPLFSVAHRGIEYWKQCADRDAADRDADTVRQRRHLSASPGWRGEGVINGVLDPIGFEIFKTELDRLGTQLRLEDLRDGVGRTVQQRRADALIEMARRSAIAPVDGLRPRPLFTVTIGIDPFTHLCQTAAGTVVAPGLLMPYLADTDIERIVYDPPNRRIEASRRRRFTGALRHIIEIRDQRCQHPSGCDEPAPRCDVDHITPHPDGITCLCNGQSLCTYHNRTVKAATDHAHPHQRPAPPPPLHPCPFDHRSAWVPTDVDTADHADSRAPPEAS
jgi:hypothetical protein